MDRIEEQTVSRLAARDEQRAGTECFAKMMTAYYQVLVDSGWVDEGLARLLTLQYQGALVKRLQDRVEWLESR